MNLTEKQNQFVSLAQKEYGSDTITRQQVVALEKKYNLSGNGWLVNNKQFKLSRGVYKLPVDGIVNPAKHVKQKVSKVEKPETVSKKIAVQNSSADNLVPSKEDTFVPFRNFKDIKNIIKSGIFYPTFITGLSGNGKTLNIVQSCAELKRELIRVNITIETDEDDLLGGFRLQDGETVWHDGPVVDAMKRGAVLL